MKRKKSPVSIVITSISSIRIRKTAFPVTNRSPINRYLQKKSIWTYWNAQHAMEKLKQAASK